MFNSLTISAGRFRRNEDGSLFIFGLLLLTMMVMLGGFAVDLMRYENTRTNLQNTLDRATLAAAALSQKMDREAVVRDYMQKAGISDQLVSVTVTTSLNSSVVNSKGRADTNPYFLPMMGINTFDAVGNSQAEQAISNLEIVLVLDVSGSMSGTKLANMKLAANAFVDTMLENDIDNRVSISIVPYNAQVNIGPDLAAKSNITHPNGVTDVNCVEIPASAHDTLALSRTDPLPMMAYADYSNNTNRFDGWVSPTDLDYAVPNYGSAPCKPNTANVIGLPNNDAEILKAQINGLEAGGNTSITLGMKWGVTLLDPSMQPAFEELAEDAKVPVALANRPYAYTDPDNMKIVILMTDGEHVSHTRIVDSYKTGPSNIYRSDNDGNYSVQFTSGRPAIAGTNQFYVPHLNTWQATAWTNGSGLAVRQDWRDIWKNLKATYVAWQFNARALGTSNNSRNSAYSTALNSMRSTYATVATMDDTLDTTCDLVKAQGVIVYGVAVDAPDSGQQVISSCATSPVHYFQATPEGMQSTFATIASNITMLKLTQ
jgi:Flp pilus assembly protein TadG